MELRVLKYFLSVAKEQNFSKAAQQLFITQPTLSRQIKELEDELGTTLFFRGTKSKKVTLTESGLHLKRRAEEILALSERTKSEFSAPDANIGGDVYIGGGETAAMNIIAKTITVIRQNTRISFFTCSAAMPTKFPKNWTADFWISEFSSIQLPKKNIII